MNRKFNIVPLLLLSAVACAQTASVPPTPTTASTAPALDPEVRQILQQLHDRKATLKDFTAQIDYSVQHPAGDVDGAIGTAVYVDDGKLSKLAVTFTHDTDEGKKVRVRKRHFILDGKAFTMVDFKGKEFKQQLAPPEKQFNPNSLDAMIPVPIGIDVDEIAMNFEVTLLPPPPPADANVHAISVVPRVKGRFDFKRLDLFIDKKLQLPVKVVHHAVGGDVTTMTFSEIKVNAGKVDFPSTVPPTEAGWTIEIK